MDSNTTSTHCVVYRHLPRAYNFLLETHILHSIVIFRKLHSNWNKLCICWGLFSSDDKYELGAATYMCMGIKSTIRCQNDLHVCFM